MPFCHKNTAGTHIATYWVKLESKSTTAEAESRGSEANQRKEAGRRHKAGSRGEGQKPRA